MRLEKLELIPISIYNFKVRKTQYHYHNELKLIYVIKGKINIIAEGTRYLCSEKDMFLANMRSIYYLEAITENEVCCIDIKSSYIEDYYENFSQIKFNLNHVPYNEVPTDETEYFWNVFYQLLSVLYKKENGYILKANEILLHLILLLTDIYSDPKTTGKEMSSKEEERLKEILDFINERYNEKITLIQIAQKVNLSPQYLSRYFSINMGMTINEYISGVRLEESFKDLMDNKKKITYVALENGFPNLKSYFKVFKEKFNTTPLKYRNTIKNTSRESILSQDQDSLNIEEILEYINKTFNQTFKKGEIIPLTIERFTIDCQKSGKMLNRSWSKLANYGRASEGLRAEWRNQLREIQREIPFEYIRFHGILSDDMMVYNEDSKGVPEFNFSYVDELVDFLLEVNIKPYIELSFIPDQLATEKNYMFYWKANISKPKDICKWKLLVENLLIHFIHRYGIDAVSDWYFEIWNEFTLNYKFDKEYYMNFLKETYLSVKAVNKSIRVGGVNVIIEELIDSKTLLEYDQFCKKENIDLDFISIKAYALVPKDKSKRIMDLVTDSNKDFRETLIIQNSVDNFVYADEGYIGSNINGMLQKYCSCDLIHKDIFINEWNTSAYPRDILHDTCFKGAFLAKNIIDNFDKVKGMGYWVFTDIFEETKISGTMFHGGIGFIMNNGLKKPIYLVYKLFNKLGETFIEKGDCFLITKSKDGGIQILLHNYCHFAKGEAKCNGDDINLNNVDDIFLKRIKNISFVLKGIKGEVVKKVYKINKDNGSVYDEWIKMGSPQSIDTEEIDYLKKKSIFGYKTQHLFVENELVINERMLPQEVMLIEIKPRK